MTPPAAPQTSPPIEAINQDTPPPPVSPFKRRSRELDIDPPPTAEASSARATRAELSAVRSDLQDVAVGGAVTARDVEYLRAEMKATHEEVKATREEVKVIRDTQTVHGEKLDLILGVFEQIPGLKDLISKPGMTGKQKAGVVVGVGGVLYLILELLLKLLTGASLVLFIVWMGSAMAGCASAPETAPFEFVEGGGSGYFKGRVYGLDLTVEVDAVALADGEEALFCPVAFIALGGWVTTGTHEGAAPACRERFGVIQTPRYIPGAVDAPTRPFAPTSPPADLTGADDLRDNEKQ